MTSGNEPAATKDLFSTLLAEMTDLEISIQLMTAQIWVTAIRDQFPKMMTEIRAGQNLKHHWELISTALKYLDWEMNYRKSRKESTDIIEGAIKSLLATKRDILDQIEN